MIYSFNDTVRNVIMPHVIMLIAFAAFFTLIPVGMEFVDGNVYPDKNVDDNSVVGANEGWIDEAILDIAFYLRLHKFGDFDRR